jgi:hypothetical protein
MLPTDRLLEGNCIYDRVVGRCEIRSILMSGKHKNSLLEASFKTIVSAVSGYITSLDRETKSIMG